MKILIFTILSLSALQIISQEPIISDTFKFNAKWYSKATQNQVKLKWEINNRVLGLQVRFPDVALATGLDGKIRDFVWMKATKDATAYIPAFTPQRTTAGGYVQHDFTVSQEKYDTRSIFPCERRPFAGQFDIQVCHGYLAFVHEKDVGDKAKDFAASEHLALAKYYFAVELKYNLRVQAEVEPLVKTKVTRIPCEDCGCASQCVLNANYELSYLLCKGGNKATQCDPNSPRSGVYTYSDIAHILFTVTPNNRVLNIHSLYATSESDETGTDLPLKYLTKISNSKGEFFCKIRMAGPASSATNGRRFTLKFIFRLDQKARFLENSFFGRSLATKFPEVNNVEISGISVKGGVPREPKAQHAGSPSYPQIEKTYTLVCAIVAMIALTCVCATISNLVPALKKNKYETVHQPEPAKI